MPPELSVVIVNWNGGELLRRCVESVYAAPPSVPYDLYIVDNASTDESLAWVRGEAAQTAAVVARGDHNSTTTRPCLYLIENADNRGFGQANNQAFALTNAPLLLLLNPDTAVTPGAIDRLIETLRQDRHTGACGPRLLNADGSLQISVWRNPPTWWAMIMEAFKLHRLLPRRWGGELLLAGHWAHNRRRAVNMLSGAAMLVRRETIAGVGGFDERFHMYGEDNEWCLRMVRAGWRLVFEPEAIVWHHGAQSSLKRWTSLEKLKVQTDADLFFQRQCLSRPRALTNLVTQWSLLKLQQTWRGWRGKPNEEVALVQHLLADELKRRLRSEG